MLKLFVAVLVKSLTSHSSTTYTTLLQVSGYSTLILSGSQSKLRKFNGWSKGSSHTLLLWSVKALHWWILHIANTVRTVSQWTLCLLYLRINCVLTFVNADLENEKKLFLELNILHMLQPMENAKSPTCDLMKIDTWEQNIHTHEVKSKSYFQVGLNVPVCFHVVLLCICRPATPSIKIPWRETSQHAISVAKGLI